MRRTTGLVAIVALTTVATAAPAVAAPAREPRVVSVATVSADGGLRVSDSAGREVQAIAGRFTNVDVAGDMVVATDREHDRLRIYRWEPSGRLEDVTAADAPVLAGAEKLAAFGRYVVVSHRDSTRLGMFRLRAVGGKVTYRVTDTLDLPRQFLRPDGSSFTPPGSGVESLTVDAAGGVLYAEQANVAVWRVRLDGDRFVGVPRVYARAGRVTDRSATPAVASMS